MSSPAVAPGKPRSLPGQLKIPGCPLGAGSRESVIQSLQQLPDNRLQGPGESSIFKVLSRWIETLFTCQSHIASENPILIWGHKLTRY